MSELICDTCSSDSTGDNCWGCDYGSHFEAILKAENCIDCSHHHIQDDPDPHDWFCDDDVKVFCTKAKRNITVACRPHHIRKECEVPDWCPKEIMDRDVKHCGTCKKNETCRLAMSCDGWKDWVQK